MNQAMHDPSTGFHDIKPLPVFNPTISVWPWIFLLLALLLGYRALAALRRRGLSNKILPAKTPYQQFLEALEPLKKDIENHEFNAREFSSTVSTSLRRYLEHQFDFPALECTNSEIDRLLTSQLHYRFPLMAAGRQQEFYSSITRALHTLERLTFSDELDTWRLQQQGIPTKLLEQCESLAHSLDEEFEREKKRRFSIVDERKLQIPPADGATA